LLIERYVEIQYALAIVAPPSPRSLASGKPPQSISL
jgi:hypothetical protein